MDELDPEEFTSISKLLQQKFIQGTWKTHIQETVPLDRIVSGLKNYLGNMSGGKILLKP
jgi:NADPH:quinone reductase-like Zn-dependent oxidoreductase